jgi:hypothetical protein
MFKTHIRYNDCRFMRSVNASPILHIYSYGKISLDLREAMRNVSPA